MKQPELFETGRDPNQPSRREIYRRYNRSPKGRERSRRVRMRIQQQDPERLRAYGRKSRAKPEAKKARMAKWRFANYGITPEQFELRMREQKSSCPICGRGFQPGEDSPGREREVECLPAATFQPADRRARGGRRRLQRGLESFGGGVEPPLRDSTARRKGMLAGAALRRSRARRAWPDPR